MTSLTDLALEALIRSRLMDKGATAGEAYKASKDPWVKARAEDKIAGRPLPKGMSDANVEQLRATAKADGVSIVDVYKRDFGEIPYRGQAAKEMPGRTAAAGVAAASLPPRGGALTPTPPATPPSGGAMSVLENKVRANEIGTRPTAGGVPYEQTRHSWTVDAPQSLYRQPYTLTAKDQSDVVRNIIAGEARAGNQQSIEAVINNALNRVGGEGFSGKTGSIYDVLTAGRDPGDLRKSYAGRPGDTQYTGWRVPDAKEAAQIDAALSTVASGTVPDPTGGSTGYLSAGTVGRGSWLQGNTTATVGGNRFGIMPGSKPGPHAATGEGYDLRNPQLQTELPPGSEGIQNFFMPPEMPPGMLQAPQMPAGTPATAQALPAPPPLPDRNPGAPAPVAVAAAPVPAPDRAPDIMATPAPAPFAPPAIPGRNPNIPTFDASQGRTGVGGPVANVPQAAAPPLPSRRPLDVTAQGSAYGRPPSATGAAGTAQFLMPGLPGRNPLRVAPPVTVAGSTGGGTPPGITGSAAASGTSIRPPQFAPPPIPGRNPARTSVIPPGITATGQTWSMDSPSFVQAPQYGRAVIQPPAPILGAGPRGTLQTNVPTYGASQGRTGMGAPFAPPALQIPIAPASRNITSIAKNVFPGGTSSFAKNVLPPPMMPQGFNVTRPTSALPPALPGGLAMNPMTAAALSRGIPTATGITGGAMPMGITGAVQFAAPKASFPMAPPSISPPPIARAPTIGLPPSIGNRVAPGGVPGTRPEGMNQLNMYGYSPFSGSQRDVMGGGGLGGAGAAKAGMSMSAGTAAQHEIADAYARAGAQLHNAAARVEQGFRVNRGSAIANMNIGRTFANATPGGKLQSLIKYPTIAGYGYL